MSVNRYPNRLRLVELAHQAGDIMRRNFTLGMKRELKEDETPVTASDKEINGLVLTELSKEFPHVNLVGEEGSLEIENAEYTVLCDPVDGTIPFCLGVPVSVFCISTMRNREPVAAVIYDPFMDRMWSAEKGEGSFLAVSGKAKANNFVSKHSSVAKSNICMIWWKDSLYHLHDVCEKLMAAGGKWINPASIAYFGGLVASGEFEATIFPGRNGWETAAMQLIVEEAGGMVTDIFGKPMKYGPKGEIEGHIISNGLIHEELLELVDSCQ